MLRAGLPSWAQVKGPNSAPSLGGAAAGGLCGSGRCLESSSGISSVSRRVEWAPGPVQAGQIPARRRDGQRVCVRVGAGDSVELGTRTGRSRSQESPPSLPAFYCTSTSESGRLLSAWSETPSTEPPPHAGFCIPMSTLQTPTVSEALHGALWAYKEDPIQAPI